MTAASGVPPWARPVLEALQLAHSLRTSDAVNGRCATSGEIEMADAHVRDACAAALASDAGTPEGEPVESLLDRAALLLAREDLRDAPPGDNRWRTTTEALRSGLVNAALRERPAGRALAESGAAAPEGEPFFHKLGCPKIGGRGTAAHCTCPPDRETPERTPAAESTTNAPETSTSLVDAELDRLLIEYARCQVQARYASRSQPEINRRAYAVEYAAAAIHAHVERRVREARDNARAAAYAEIAVRRDNERREKEEG